MEYKECSVCFECKSLHSFSNLQKKNQSTPKCLLCENKQRKEQRIARKNKKDRIQEPNSQWITLKCKNCKNTFKLYRNTYNEQKKRGKVAKFCSRRCFYDWRRKNNNKLNICQAYKVNVDFFNAPPLCVEHYCANWDITTEKCTEGHTYAVDD